MLAQRRKLLQYLRRADFDAYAKMLSALGLKDRYMKQVSKLPDHLSAYCESPARPARPHAPQLITYLSLYVCVSPPIYCTYKTKMRHSYAQSMRSSSSCTLPVCVVLVALECILRAAV